MGEHNISVVVIKLQNVNWWVLAMLPNEYVHTAWSAKCTLHQSAKLHVAVHVQ